MNGLPAPRHGGGRGGDTVADTINRELAGLMNYLSGKATAIDDDRPVKPARDSGVYELPELRLRRTRSLKTEEKENKIVGRPP